jgi:hypothetical protein
MMKQEQSAEEFRNDLIRMAARVRELERQLADAMNGKLPEDQHVDPSMLMVSSMVSSRTREPMIMLRWFTFVAQIGVEQARDLAFNLIEAIEAAKSDAFLMQFMSNAAGNIDAGLQLVAAFREFKQRQEREA